MADTRYTKIAMKNLIIIGAGGFGREVLCWALDVEPSQNEWRVGGFLDDNLAALDGYMLAHQIIGAPSSYVPNGNDVFICAIGHPKTKIKVCRSLQDRGALFINLIHPTALVGRFNKLGCGCILCPRSCITTNVTLGDFVTLNANSGVGHDGIVDDGSTISAYCDITGFAKLGKRVFLGSHAVVLPGKVVGDDAIVGAGSVVVKNVKPGATVFGVPAKQIAGF